MEKINQIIELEKFTFTIASLNCAYNSINTQWVPYHFEDFQEYFNDDCVEKFIYLSEIKDIKNRINNLKRKLEQEYNKLQLQFFINL